MNSKPASYQGVKTKKLSQMLYLFLLVIMLIENIDRSLSQINSTYMIVYTYQKDLIDRYK